ncbi:MAG: LD-carboxypeptidase [Acidobacteria bacterium]|nr:MAG: LD-carboxypeptidase [Acidobacteriota bacterium]
MDGHIKPAALRAGDTIGIVAPASNIKLDLLREGCRELESLGFKTYFRPDIVSSYRYLAGPRERRLGEFLEMLRSPDIHAIFCARGGYGSGHLIPDMDPDVVRQNAKIVSGASDITLLLNWVERAGVVSFHGPMVATSIRQGAEGYDRQLLLDVLKNKQKVRFPIGGTTILRPGQAEGRLIGGCLSLLVSTLGTKNEIDTGDSIVIIEDVDAKPYQIDRMITHLKQARKFEGVRGAVFGEMLNCVQHPNQGYALQDILLDLLGEFAFPILFGFSTGHTSRPNVIVPFGVRARLALGASTSFELLEPAVV